MKKKIMLLISCIALSVSMAMPVFAAEKSDDLSAKIESLKDEGLYSEAAVLQNEGSVDAYNSAEGSTQRYNATEHFTCTQTGTQNAVKNNLSNPLSAWKSTHTSSTYWSKSPFTIQLREMYIGSTANRIVEYENKFNYDPTSTQQWILMKFWIKNEGNTSFRASDAVNLTLFYTTKGERLRIYDTASFCEDRNGMGVYSVKLASKGSAAECWIGLLVDKSAGYPLLALDYGYNSSVRAREYSFLSIKPNATTTKVTAGWKKSGTKWWYQNADGSYPKSKWQKIGGKYYHFDANGYMETSKWIGGTYYVKADGTMAVSEWVAGKYYVDANGKYVPGKKKVTAGWKKSGSKYWYQNADGSYPKNKWQKIDGKYYHFDANGYMQTNKWIDGTYYVKSNGVMATNEWVDGKYYVDNNGKYVGKR